MSSLRARGRLGGLAGGVQAQVWGCIPACTEADTPQQTTTAAGGTHPTGIHSCFTMKCGEVACYCTIQNDSPM